MEEITAIAPLLGFKLKQICLELGVGLSGDPYRDYYRPCGEVSSQTAIHLPCLDQRSAERLFSLRQKLSQKILQLGCGSWVFVYAGKSIYPGWEVDMMIQEKYTEGDLLKRIADAPYSSGIVDIGSNMLLWASRYIESTTGRPALDMLSRELFDYTDLQGNLRIAISGNQSATWEGFEQILSDLNRDLLQQRVLENYRYRACTWVKRDGMWHVEPVSFIAQRIEVATIYGHDCRITTDVRIES